MSAEPLLPSEPYVGPRPFKLAEKFFYGRDAEIRELRDLLVARHIVLLYSPSGAGKTLNPGRADPPARSALLPGAACHPGGGRDSAGVQR